MLQIIMRKSRAMKHSKEAGEWETMIYGRNRKKKSQHCWTGFFSERENPISRKKKRQNETRMQRLS